MVESMKKNEGENLKAIYTSSKFQSGKFMIHTQKKGMTV